MDKDKLDKLKTLAQEALQAEIKIANSRNHQTNDLISISTFHAIANPKAILELITDYEQLQEDYERVFRNAADESAKVAMLKKEADWLADNARARWCAVPDGKKCRYPSKPTISKHCVKCWREAAKKAVEKQEDEKEAESEAYWR